METVGDGVLTGLPHSLFSNGLFLNDFGFQRGSSYGGDFSGGGIGAQSAWVHNPGHRGGVPYSDRAVASRFGGRFRPAGAGFAGVSRGGWRTPGGARSVSQRTIGDGFAGRSGEGPWRSAESGRSFGNSYGNSFGDSFAGSRSSANRGFMSSAYGGVVTVRVNAASVGVATLRVDPASEDTVRGNMGRGRLRPRDRAGPDLAPPDTPRAQCRFVDRRITPAEGMAAATTVIACFPNAAGDLREIPGSRHPLHIFRTPVHHSDSRRREHHRNTFRRRMFRNLTLPADTLPMAVGQAGAVPKGTGQAAIPTSIKRQTADLPATESIDVVCLQVQ